MSMLALELRRLMGSGLDISEHLGLLRGLAMAPDVQTVVEIGFRTGVSATALASAGKALHCIDVLPCLAEVGRLKKLGANFTFKCADSHKVEIPKCDLLHIDSLHTYAHLREELRLHAPRVTKWIALHDTTTFCDVGKDGTKPGLFAAIAEFLTQSEEGVKWRILLNLTNNNGLTVLQRHRA